MSVHRTRMQELATAWSGVATSPSPVRLRRTQEFHRPVPDCLARAAGAVGALPLVPQTEEGAAPAPAEELLPGETLVYCKHPEYWRRKDTMLNDQLYKNLDGPDVRRRTCVLRKMPSLEPPRVPLAERLAKARREAQEHAERSDAAFRKAQMKEAEARAEAAAEAAWEAAEAGEGQDDEGEEHGVEGAAGKKKKKGKQGKGKKGAKKGRGKKAKGKRKGKKKKK
eukprot:g6238.t1